MSGDLAVAALDAGQARALTETIKADLGSLAANIAAAFRGRAWEPLGYSSWSQYTAAEFTLDQYRLPAGAERDEVLATLAEAGMSQRQIAAATGLNQSTISRALAPGDANASPERPVWDDPHGWLLLLAEHEEEADGLIRSGPAGATLEEHELVIWVLIARIGRDLLHLIGYHEATGGEIPGSPAHLRGLAENVLGFRLPLVWEPVPGYLRMAERCGCDVRGLVAGMVRDDMDPKTLTYAAEVLTILGGTS